MSSDSGYGATVAKRRLARRLATLRVRAGMSLNEANDKLGWSRGRLNRFEANQWRLPDASHVRDLARIYGATEPEREELEELVARARARLWWHEPDKETDRVFTDEFAGFENDAARISVYIAPARGSDHRGIAAVPVGYPAGAAVPDRAPCRDEPKAECRTADAAVRRRPSPWHEQPD